MTHLTRHLELLLFTALRVTAVQEPGAALVWQEEGDDQEADAHDAEAHGSCLQARVIDIRCDELRSDKTR